MSMTVRGTLKAEILALANRSGGMDASDVTTPCSKNSAGTMCNRLAQRGEIFAAKMGHRTIRYFGTQAEAMRYATHAVRTPHTGKPKAAPTRTQFDQQEAINPGVRPTICPGYSGESRYRTVEPGFVGEFTAEWRRLTAA